MSNKIEGTKPFRILLSTCIVNTSEKEVSNVWKVQNAAAIYENRAICFHRECSSELVTKNQQHIDCIQKMVDDITMVGGLLMCLLV